MNQATPKQIRSWRRYLAEERLEADTYRYLARGRSGEEKQVFLKLAGAEERHESYWEKLLGEKAYPAPKAPIRARIINYLACTFGTIFILAMMQRAEARSGYDKDSDVPAAMAADERIHSEVVRILAGRQRAAMSGTFRAAVFGVNDGLVSTCALILGVIGAGVSRDAVLMTGFAGLLAGALSMAAGEYISVRSQVELLQASDPDPEASQAIGSLDLEANELALVYQARGMQPDEAEAKAQEVITQIKAGDAAAWASSNSTPEEVGTAPRAAFGSFVMFATGSFLPIIPFLFPLTVSVAAIISLCLVGVALLVTGGIVGLLSGAAPAPRAFRQLLIGGGAAAITYLLGLLFGASGL